MWLVLLDEPACHTAGPTRALAARLGIELAWPPKQWSELNAMDHLWQGLKQAVLANRQYRTADEQADWAERWVLGLTARQAKRKAGVSSPTYWLRRFV